MKSREISAHVNLLLATVMHAIISPLKGQLLRKGCDNHIYGLNIAWLGVRTCNCMLFMARPEVKTILILILCLYC